MGEWDSRKRIIGKIIGENNEEIKGMKEKIILVAALCIMGRLAITGCGDDAIREGAEDLQET